MINEELMNIIDELRGIGEGFDAEKYDDFFAVQVTLKDLGEVFYVEIKNHRLSIEPYEYHDKQANVIISTSNFINLIKGRLNPVLAFTTGKLKIEGDINKAKELAGLFRK